MSDPQRPRFQLFAFWRTSATYRVRVALNLKGLVAEETIVDLEANAQRSPAFLAVNPMGAIPALIDRDGPALPLTQSLAILEFLDEFAPTPPLLPPDPHGRARVRSLALILAADTHPLIAPRVRKVLATAGFDAAATRDWMSHWFNTGLQAFEQRLHEPATGRFCHGDAVTSADICLASILVMTRVLGIPTPDLPQANRIMAECEALDAFARAAPARQAGAPAA